MAGQSINDRLTAARLSIAGQGLAKSVCKATTEEVIGPKKKHLDYLLHCTNEPNVSIPQLANLLIERSSSASWVVVFKALVTVHHLMCYGNERFTQYLASSNCTFQLSNFLDKTGVQMGYDMSTFIRRYAKYLNEKAMSYRIAAFDFCKVKRGSKEDGILRTMNAEKLVKTLPVLQNQVDALLEFDCTANELTNGVINTAFMLLFRDLIRLFACYNDGIINLLEKYFDMNKKMVRDALDIYKKFLIRMDRVAEFLKVAENVGIDKGDIPDLTKAPSSLLDALEQHLATLEGKKGGATTPTQPPSSSSAGRQTSVKNAVLALSNTSSAFGTAAASAAGPRQSVNGGSGGEDDPLKKLALEEEQAILELHKERRLKELAGQSPSSDGSAGIGTNPFLSSPMRGGGNLDSVDLFGSPTIDGGHGGGVSKASDDLLCLANNPFSGVVSAPSAVPSFWSEQNGGGGVGGSTFVPESSFTAVFGGSATNQPAVAASHGISISETGLEKGCDLTIPGLNPFAGVSSPTPSPSVPFEFGGLGTTPILGAPESQGFSFGDGLCSAAAQVAPCVTDDSDLFAETDGSGVAAPLSQQFEANFAFGSPNKPQPKPSSVPRPISPAPGTMAPKPTPVSSPAPPSFLSDADVFGSFNFGGSKQQQQRSSGGAFDLGSGESHSSPVRGGAAHSTSSAGASSSFTALDDLNATIRASLGGGGGSSLSTGVVGSASSSPPPPPNPPSSCTQLPSAKQPFGFGSPGKMASDFDAFGDILQPLPSSGAPLGGTAPSGQTKAQSKVITGDLDSSLASLVQNLEINRASSGLHKSGHVWNSPKNTAKTGGANWTPHVASSTAAGGGGGGAWNSPQHTYQAMGSTTGRPADWSSGMMAGHFPQAGVQTFTGSPVVGGTAGSQVPLGGGVTQPPSMMAKGFATSGAVPQPLQQQPTLDPFGAL